MDVYELSKKLESKGFKIFCTSIASLSHISKKGWIIPVPSTEESRRKEYRLTERGRQALQGELARLRELVRNGESILEQEAEA
ncbi:MAG: helix-turn-helix transcriptional regulator [Clostridiales bacterium]|nr:helix-turn-helix transcriptional regulator [Clostridiales bacterium]